jgi:CrcB protein
MRFLLVCLGGAFGAGARYAISGFALRLFGSSSFPFGTVVVNVVGSFLLGLVLEVAFHSEVFSPNLRIAIAVGVLGSFTTFSTFSYETLALLREGAFCLGLLNVFVQLFGSLAAVFLGLATAGLLVRS